MIASICHIDVTVLIGGDAPGISKLALLIPLLAVYPYAVHGGVVNDVVLAGVHTIHAQLIVVVLGGWVLPLSQADCGQTLGVIELRLQAREQK
jgi:hypothetical protein